MDHTHECTRTWLLRLRHTTTAQPEAIRSLMRDHIEGISLPLAGLLEVLVTTLPRDDPWRHMSARTKAFSAGREIPQHPGVVCDDSTPLAWPDDQDLDIPRLSPWAGTFLAAAGHGGWRQVRQAIRTMDAHLSSLGPFAPHYVTQALAEALCWIRERRDSYGAGDWAAILTRPTIASLCTCDPIAMDTLAAQLVDTHAITR